MPQITVHRSLDRHPSAVQPALLYGTNLCPFGLEVILWEHYAGGPKYAALIQLSGYSLVTHGNESSVAACTCSARANPTYRYSEIKRFMPRKTTMRTIVGLDHVRFHITHTTSDIEDGARPVYILHEAILTVNTPAWTFLIDLFWASRSTKYT